jgi:pimeloyl-ACP methyl ester carboxylesterase
LIEKLAMKIHTIKGAARVNLHVREYGNPAGIPILFIHGWSQSQLCWSKRLPLARDDFGASQLVWTRAA